MLFSARFLLRCPLPGGIGWFQHVIVLCFNSWVWVWVPELNHQSCPEVWGRFPISNSLCSGCLIWTRAAVELQIVPSSSRPVLNDSSWNTIHTASKWSGSSPQRCPEWPENSVAGWTKRGRVEKNITFVFSDFNGHSSRPLWSQSAASVILRTPASIMGGRAFSSQAPCCVTSS